MTDPLYVAHTSTIDATPSLPTDVEPCGCDHSQLREAQLIDALLASVRAQERAEQYRAECEGLRGELAARREVCEAAVAWRKCDESEPIPSAKPNQALARVAFAVDAFLASDLTRPGFADSAEGRPADDVSADPVPDLCQRCRHDHMNMHEEPCAGCVAADLEAESGDYPAFEPKQQTDQDSAPDPSAIRAAVGFLRDFVSHGWAHSPENRAVANDLADALDSTTPRPLGAKPDASSVETETPVGAEMERKGCGTCTRRDLGFNEGPCNGCCQATGWPNWESTRRVNFFQATPVSPNEALGAELTAAIARAEAAERELAEVRGRLSECHEALQYVVRGYVKELGEGVKNVVYPITQAAWFRAVDAMSRSNLTPAQEKDHG